MRKTLFILPVILLIGILVPGCEKQPTACFDVATNVPMVHHEVDFTNCSTEGYSYEWDFGDGGTSMQTAWFHTYESAGTYTVKLKAISKNGRKSDEVTKTVTVCGNAAFQWSGSTNLITVHVGSDTRSGYPSTVYSDCQSQITYWLPVGTYSYTASEQAPGTHTWSGTFTITSQGCTIVYLQ